VKKDQTERKSQTQKNLNAATHKYRSLPSREKKRVRHMKLLGPCALPRRMRKVAGG
jgi:hypothetical protein